MQDSEKKIAKCTRCGVEWDATYEKPPYECNPKTDEEKKQPNNNN